jgi:two-component system NtrC family sensor kinase
MKPIFYRPAQLRGLVFLSLLLMALAILGGMIWRNIHHFETVFSYVNYSHRIQNVSAGLQQSLIEYLTEVEPPPQPILLTKTLGEIDTLMADSRDLSTETRSSLETVRSMLAGLTGMKREEIHKRLSMALKVMSRTLENEALLREQLLEGISLDIQTELYVALATFAGILLLAIVFFHFSKWRRRALFARIYIIA